MQYKFTDITDKKKHVKVMIVYGIWIKIILWKISTSHIKPREYIFFNYFWKDKSENLISRRKCLFCICFIQLLNIWIWVKFPKVNQIVGVRFLDIACKYLQAINSFEFQTSWIFFLVESNGFCTVQVIYWASVQSSFVGIENKIWH